MSKQQRPTIPLPPAVQPHELQFKILREKQALERDVQYGRGPEARSSSRGGGGYVYNRDDPGYDSGSRRSGSRRGGSDRFAYDDGENSQRTGSGSRRSAVTGSVRTSSTARTGASISSSVALGTLNKLETMLLEERKARQGAESMLLSLQKERVAREEAVRQSETTRKQLDALMGALRSVVTEPSSSNNIQRLQSLLDNTHVDKGAYRRMKAEELTADRGEGADRFAKNGTSLSPPVESKYTKKVAHTLPALYGGESSERSSNGGGQKTFLDGLGHYERVKERERQQQKGLRRGGAGQ